MSIGTAFRCVRAAFFALTTMLRRSCTRAVIRRVAPAALVAPSAAVRFGGHAAAEHHHVEHSDHAALAAIDATPWKFKPQKEANEERVSRAFESYNSMPPETLAGYGMLGLAGLVFVYWFATGADVMWLSYFLVFGALAVFGAVTAI